MSFTIFKIPKDVSQQAVDALNSFNIPFDIAAYPEGKAILIEQYQSSINNPKANKSGYTNYKDQHDKMNKYAIEKGYDSVSDAILKMGGHEKFKKNFKKEYNSIINTKVIS